MDLALLSGEGFVFALRWLHFFFGVIWIGMLYYFNFVQGAFFGEADASTKSVAIQKLVPRALWWFRWGAMGTAVTGWLIIGYRLHMGGTGMLLSSWGLAILLSGIMGTIMWFNVWFVIWPNQKIIIASTTAAANGGQANPAAAGAAARAGVASRTNVLLSIGLLFFMGAASHLPVAVSGMANITLFWVVMGVILGAIELNALKGKMGPLTTIKGVITCGFALAIALYLLFELLLK